MRLNLIKSDVGARVRGRQGQQKDLHDRHSMYHEFGIGQSVWTRNFHGGSPWTLGVVAGRLGPLSYLIRLPTGELWRCHIDHLREGHVQLPDSLENSQEVDPPDLDDFSVPTPQIATDNTPPDNMPLGPDGTDTGEVPTNSNHPSTSQQDDAPANLRSNPYPSRNRRRPDRLYSTFRPSGTEQ